MEWVLKLWIVNARVVCCLLMCSMLCDMRDPASAMTVSTSERGNRLGGGGVIEHKLLRQHRRVSLLSSTSSPLLSAQSFTIQFGARSY